MLYDPRIEKRHARNERLAVILDNISKRLSGSEYAWCQNAFAKYNADKEFGVCAVTAVRYCTDKGERRDHIYAALARALPQRLYDRIRELTPYQKLIFFNDYGGTDQAAVFDLVTRARAKVPVHASK